MRKIRYIIGLIVVLGILVGIMVCPLPSLLSPQAPHLALFKRGMCIILFSAFLCLFRIFRYVFISIGVILWNKCEKLTLFAQA